MTAAGVAEEVERVRQQVLDGYPAHIALAYQRVFDEPEDRLHQGYFGVLPSLLYHWTVVLLADYANCGLQSTAVAEGLRQLVQGRPTEGKWLGLLGALAKSFLESGAQSFVPELVRSLFDERRRPQETWRLLDELVKARNACHFVPPLPAEREVQIAGMKAAFTRLFSIHTWMRDYSLTWHAVLPSGELIEPGIPVRREMPPYSSLTEGRSALVLHAPGTAARLHLDPFLFVATCPKCGQLAVAPRTEVFLYQQLGPGRAFFRGAYHDTTRKDQEFVQGIRERLERVVGPGSVCDASDPVERLLECAGHQTEESIEDLKASHRYLEEALVIPGRWPEVLDTFLHDERPALLLASSAGSGKTSLLAWTAQQLARAGFAVVFWHHRNYPTEPVDQSLEAMLGGPSHASLGEICSFAAERLPVPAGFDENRIVVIADGLNERDDYENALEGLLTLIEHSARSGGHVKVLAGVRDTALREQRPRLEPRARWFFSTAEASVGDWLAPMTIPMSEFAESQFQELFDRYQSLYHFQGSLPALPPATQELLREPLMLRLVAEAYRQRALPATIASEEVFDAYVNERLERYGASKARILASTLRHCARMMYRRDSMEIDTERLLSWLESRDCELSPFAIYRTLLDEGLLTEQKLVRPGFTREFFSFTFERCGEFLLGRYVLPAAVDEGSLGETLAEIAGKYDAYPSVAAGLKIYLRDQLLQNQSQGLRTIRDAPVLAGLAGVRAVGELLGGLEAGGQAEAADEVRRTLSQVPAEHRAPCLRRAMDVAFDTGPVERLVGLGTDYEDAVRALPGQERAVAEAQVWIGDVLYNRADNYERATEVLRGALALLRRVAPLEHRTFETAYFLARLLSDIGEPAEAIALAQECLAFHEAQGGLDPRGLALAHYLLYMIHGDAGGDFARGVPHLDVAQRIFTDLGDRRAVGRLWLSRAIVRMCTGTVEEALTSVDRAVALCERATDIQGRAYARLCEAAICIQKASLLTDARQADLLRRARHALDAVAELHSVTHEGFLSTMRKANESVLELLVGRTGTARALLEEVISESTESGDFFNLFDAEVLLAGHLDRNEDGLKALLRQAEENDYTQGRLHILWHLAKMHEDAGAGEESARFAAEARAVATQLGWGHDPRESLYMGFYAGIFL